VAIFLLRRGGLAAQFKVLYICLWYPIWAAFDRAELVCVWELPQVNPAANGAIVDT
jgi:hypothetical protein